MSASTEPNDRGFELDPMGQEQSLAEVLAPFLRVLAGHWLLIASAALLAGAAAYGLSFLVPPTFTARMSFIVPQVQQNPAAAALASLGVLSGLAGAAGKGQIDQYVSLMESTTISDRIVEKFDLQREYDVKYRVDARKELKNRVLMIAGKKDNIVSVEVEDRDPQRAADMANAYADELRKLSNNLALTEAQQRRVFFDQQLRGVKTAMATAQAEVQRAGLSAGTLKGEPKLATETYARTKAEIAAMEVSIRVLAKSVTDSAPEMQRAKATLAGLQTQLAAQERPLAASGGDDANYIGAFREFKYQEALFEIYARQFELAKLDEAKEGAVIQVVDVASAPERRSKPRRLYFALVGCLIGLVAVFGYLLKKGKRPANTS